MGARWLETLPTTGVAAVDSALAGLWLLDVGQGDLAAARKRAEEAVAAEPTATALFARGVVAFHQGDCRAALADFEHGLTAGAGAELRLRIAAVACRAEVWRNTVTPDGFAFLFAETAARFGDPLTETVWQERRRAARELTQELAGQTVNELVGDLAAYLPRERALGSVHASRGYRRLVGREALGYTQGVVRRLAGTAHAPLADLVTAVTPVIQADIARAAGSLEAARAELRAARPALAAFDDPCLIAWAALLEGDAIAAGPTGASPVTFGHRLTVSISQCSTLAEEPRLFARPPLDAAAARACYEEARDLYRAAGARRGEGAALLRLAHLAGLGGDFQAAAAGYREACALLEGTGDELGAWAARAGMVWTDIHTGGPETAIAERAAALGRWAEGRDALAWGLGWGLTFAMAGRQALLVQFDADAAVRGATAARAVYSELDAPLLEVQAHGDRVAALVHVDQTADAVVASWEQLDCCDRAAQHPAYRDPVYAGVKNAGLVSLYGLLVAEEDFEGLQKYQARLASALARLPPLDEASLDLTGLTMEAADMGWNDNSLAIMARAALPDPREVDYQLRYSRALQARDRDDVAAQTLFEEAFGAADGLPDRDFYWALVRVGQGRYEEARRFLRGYVARPPTTPAVRDGEAARVLQQNRERFHLRAAMIFSRLASWPEARAQIEVVAPLDDLRRKIAANTGTGELDVLITIGRILAGEGRLDEARDVYQACVNALEERRRRLPREAWRRGFTARPEVARTYREWLDLLAARGEWEEAFLQADLVSARSAVEATRGNELLEGRFAEDESYGRYKAQAALVERLATTLMLLERREGVSSEELSPRREEYRLQQAELAAREAVLSNSSRDWHLLALPRIAAVSVQTAAAALPARALLLMLVPAERTLLGFAVTRAGLAASWAIPYGPRLGYSRLDWFQGVKDFTSWMSGGGEDGEEGAALARAFLYPCAAALHDSEHVVVVPVAELAAMPFQALPWRGLPLGLAKTISYLSSPSMLRDLREAAAGAAGALVVGDPVSAEIAPPDGEERVFLPALPGSRVEGQLVAASHGVRPVLGHEGTLAEVRRRLAERPRVVHFATHGLIFPTNVLASGVVLPDGNLLTIGELAGLRITADLMVMSACDTGQGVLHGAELVGVTRALLQAGVRTVVATQWQTADVCGTIVMAGFHAAVARHVPVVDALAEAARSLRLMTAAQALAWLDAHAGEAPAGNCLRADVYSLAGGREEALAYYQHAADGYRERGDLDSASACLRAIEDIREQDPRSSVFDPGRLIFEPPMFWAPFVAVGAWR